MLMSDLLQLIKIPACSRLIIKCTHKMGHILMVAAPPPPPFSPLQLQPTVFNNDFVCLAVVSGEN